MHQQGLHNPKTQSHCIESAEPFQHCAGKALAVAAIYLCLASCAFGKLAVKGHDVQVIIAGEGASCRSLKLRELRCRFGKIDYSR